MEKKTNFDLKAYVKEKRQTGLDFGQIARSLGMSLKHLQKILSPEAVENKPEPPKTSETETLIPPKSIEKPDLTASEDLSWMD